MKVIAVVPAFGRLPLLRHTISRLLNKNGCSEVIVVGHEFGVAELCEELGAIYVSHRNKPLGAKWNFGFMVARAYEPDACLFVGSSDWVSDNWIPTMFPYLEKYDMAGKAGCYLLDIQENNYRLCYWPGYKDGSPLPSSLLRENESIGIGRLISRQGLDKIKWRPFDDHKDSSLDWTMYNKLKNNVLVTDDSIHSMAISCDQWNNKHTFEDHWSNRYKSEKVKDPHAFCKKWFDEYDRIFKD